MLRNLVHSKHKMISMGSAAALKNLLAAKPAHMNFDGTDSRSKSNMPSLHVSNYVVLNFQSSLIGYLIRKIANDKFMMKCSHSLTLSPHKKDQF